MSEAGHDLAAEFPEYVEAIRHLKTSDEHFRRLADRYHELVKAIHRAEQRIDTIGEADEENLKKQRLQVKDELFALMNRHGSAHESM